MNKQKGFTAIEALIALLVLAGAGGWIANIVKIAGSNFDQISGVLVVRCVGVFVAPVGSIMGFM